MLPGWYGFGTAIKAWLAARPRDGMRILREMYREWPFFQTLLSNMDMVLAKSNIAIASRYAELVEDTELREAIFPRLRAEWQYQIELLKCHRAGDTDERVVQAIHLGSRSNRATQVVWDRRAPTETTMTWDILIRRGTVIDGGGSPGTIGDIALAAGRIAALDPSLIGDANKVIEFFAAWMSMRRERGAWRVSNDGRCASDLVTDAVKHFALDTRHWRLHPVRLSSMDRGTLGEVGVDPHDRLRLSLMR